MNRQAIGAVLWGPAFILTFAVSSAVAATEQVIYSFCSQSSCADGRAPFDGLIDVTGVLYGTTDVGGKGACHHGCGTVFSFDPATGAERVLHSFRRPNADGKYPFAGLIDLKGDLYGTTEGDNGRHQSCGNAFSVDARSGAFTVLHSFGGSDGCLPEASLLLLKGSMFGSTVQGGTYDAGTVFVLNPNTGAETVLHSFQGSDGRGPSGLIDVNGLLYGAAGSGGVYGYGAIFTIEPATGAETVVYSFQMNGTNGYFPEAPLIDVNGTLYGTTYASGGGAGSLYSFDPGTGAVSFLIDFGSGGSPGRAPLVNVDGVLFGTLGDGSGSTDPGSVYSFDPATGTEQIVHRFQKNGTDGYWPGSSSLLRVGRTLYGTTSGGGSDRGGTIYSLTHWDKP